MSKKHNVYLKYFIKIPFKITKKFIMFIKIIIFYFKIRKYKNIKKIIYTITPSPSLRNVGDHAQVIAIKKWFMENFNEYLVLEFDKNEIYKYLNLIKKIVNEDDLIFLHSGGNFGDRSLWSEGARRSIINNFPKNKIISLPQTIFFSNTQKGRKELEKTKHICNNHKDLTIIARDSYSFKLAKNYFPIYV
jgi:exopolysaccharide biosynthesis predicted pyruvyltransferase EpsI